MVCGLLRKPGCSLLIAALIALLTAHDASDSHGFRHADRSEKVPACRYSKPNQLQFIGGLGFDCLYANRRDSPNLSPYMAADRRTWLRLRIKAAISTPEDRAFWATITMHARKDLPPTQAVVRVGPPFKKEASLRIPRLMEGRELAKRITVPGERVRCNAVGTTKIPGPPRSLRHCGGLQLSVSTRIRSGPLGSGSFTSSVKPTR